MSRLVSCVERSGDAKLTATGNVSSTWVAQQSCHDDCPLKANGCYAEIGNSGIHTRRMNAAASGRKMGLSGMRQKLATLEAAGIRTLSGLRKLRVHVVGDCATPMAASLIGQAMVDHGKKFGKRAWTYTHSWRRVPLASWRGANVLASCDSVTQLPAAKARGYATSVIVPPHPTHKPYQLEGHTIIPCPAQFKRDGRRVTTCEHCTLCQRPELLRAKDWSVGFEPDAGTQKRVMLTMAAAA